MSSELKNSEGVLTKNIQIQPIKLKKHIGEIMEINESTLPENYPIEYWALAIAQHHSFVAILQDKKKDIVVGYCLAAVLPMLNC